MLKRTRLNVTSAALVVGIVALCSPTFAADPSALLKEVDDGINAADDETFLFEVVTEEKGKEPVVMKLKVQIKDGQRLTEFLAPGNLKGMKALTLSHSQIYVYLPEYKKVRRVASHVSHQGFMGTSYSQADMALARYSDAYAATIVAEDDAGWTLRLLPKPGAEAPYPKLELVIDKKVKRPVVLRYYNPADTLAKTETRTRTDCQGPSCTAVEMTMIDHRKGGLKTTFKRVDWKVNTGLSQGLFSKRSLQRRR